MTDWPDFRNLTREEAITKLKEMGDEKLAPLIKWIAESCVLDDSYDAIRRVIADAYRAVEVTRTKIEGRPRERAKDVR